MRQCSGVISEDLTGEVFLHRKMWVNVTKFNKSLSVRQHNSQLLKELYVHFLSDVACSNVILRFSLQNL